jgi:hypothetical protein
MVAGAPVLSIEQEMVFRPGCVDTLASTAPSAETMQRTRPTISERIPPQVTVKWPDRHDKWYPSSMAPTEWLSSGSDRREESISAASSRASESRGREDRIKMERSRLSGR